MTVVVTRMGQEKAAALVTGASRGLGAAIAERLAAAGHPVAVNFASSQRLAAEVVDSIEQQGGTAHAYRADVTDSAQVADMVRAVREDLGPVGILVLNATGAQREVPAVDLTWDDVVPMLDFFVKSPVLLLHAVLPDMRTAGWGRIVHIGSDVVQRAPHGNSAYVAAKSAQLGLARVWAQELGGLGVTVNTVSPGWIPVERHQGVDVGVLHDYADSIPVGRLGHPGDVAAAVAFLATEEAGFVNGAVLSVNGGSTVT
jgi:NAD(P)-dependent dehydrogenase (short-subunit alcohol dehydrogenase family)